MSMISLWFSLSLLMLDGGKSDVDVLIDLFVTPKVCYFMATAMTSDAITEHALITAEVTWIL